MITRLKYLFTAVMLLALALAGIWLAGGCATSGSSTAPKPGSGIAEYRAVAGEAHKAVSTTVKSLEGLVVSPTQTSVPPAALNKFDKSLSELEVTSVKARARAEAIIARGQTYFEEWRTNLFANTNQATSHAETAHYDRLRVQFEMIRERSRDVREEFRPFMNSLREFRARLDSPAGTTTNKPPLPQQLDDLIAGGRRVMKTLDSVSTTLAEAEADVRATFPAKE